MKKFILAFLLIILGAGFHSVSADIIVDDPNIETVLLTKERVLELWGVKEEDVDPDDPDRAWDAWGYEKVDRETREVVSRSLTFFLYLEQTSPRV